MIVKARPLKKLCEYEGQQLPKHYKSDCYNDVDETEFACKEKHRITVKFYTSFLHLVDSFRRAMVLIVYC